MKIKEFLEKLDELGEEERVALAHKVLGKFSPMSIQSLMNFQSDWVGQDKLMGIKRPYEDFVKSQNEEIRMCCRMESSDFGSEVRSRLNLEKFDPEQEI